jgi:hypothetical protein
MKSCLARLGHAVGADHADSLYGLNSPTLSDSPEPSHHRSGELHPHPPAGLSGECGRLQNRPKRTLFGLDSRGINPGEPLAGIEPTAATVATRPRKPIAAESVGSRTRQPLFEASTHRGGSVLSPRVPVHAADPVAGLSRLSAQCSSSGIAPLHE